MICGELSMSAQRLEKFGDQVRAIRREQGIAQEALAVLAGLDRSYMGRVERGEINISLTKIYQIADALKVSPREFFT